MTISDAAIRSIIRFAVIAGSALLAACSYKYSVEAIFIDGELAFVNENTSPYCLISFKFSNSMGAAMWEFDAEDGNRNAIKCSPQFPLSYGRAPKGAVTIIPARPLRSGELYTISGSDGTTLEGSFRYQIRRVTTIENLDMQRADVKAAQQSDWDRQKVAR